MPERWTRAVVRLRFPILAGWLAIAAAGIAAALELPQLLSSSFSVPGSESEHARAILMRNFDERPDGVFTVVFPVRSAPGRALEARLRRELTQTARTVPSGKAGPLRQGGGVVYGDVETTLDLQHAKRYTSALRRALRAYPGPPVLVTGQPALEHDLEPVLAADLRHGEETALPAAALVLLVTLGLSGAVVLPFLVAGCTIAGALAVVWGAAHVTPMNTYVPNLVELIGVGLAIDYSLLVVHRFREEAARATTTEDAIVATMATAGRAVVVSGGAVAIGLGLLLLMPVPFIRSLGIGGVLVPLFSVAAAATILPVLLSFAGDRGLTRVPVAAMVRSRGVPLPGRSRRRRGRRPWGSLARAVMARPVVFAGAAAGLLLAAAAPAAFMQLTPGSVSTLPDSPESVRGLALLRDRVGSGAVTPTEVVVDAGAAGRTRTPPVDAAVARLADGLFRDPEVMLVARGARWPYVDASGRYERLIVMGRHEYGAAPSRALVHRLRQHLVPGAHFPGGVDVTAGGAPPQGVDYLARVYDTFPWLVAGVLALTYLVLVRTLRSLLLPLKAVLLNLLSVAAAYGLLVVIFRWGVGASLLGLHRATEVEGWIPLFLFATLFGLSMDYEIFLVTRMRESWDRLHDNAQAVADGLERTGGVITAAAAIMAAALSGFVAGDVAGLQEFGVGLSLAVLIDATLVRTVLVPALMALLERYNWWLPAPFTRLVRVPDDARSPLPRSTPGAAGQAPSIAVFASERFGQIVEAEGHFPPFRRSRHLRDEPCPFGRCRRQPVDGAGRQGMLV